MTAHEIRLAGYVLAICWTVYAFGTMASRFGLFEAVRLAMN